MPKVCDLSEHKEEFVSRYHRRIIRTQGTCIFYDLSEHTEVYVDSIGVSDIPTVYDLSEHKKMCE